MLNASNYLDRHHDVPVEVHRRHPAQNRPRNRLRGTTKDQLFLDTEKWSSLKVEPRLPYFIPEASFPEGCTWASGRPAKVHEITKLANVWADVALKTLTFEKKDEHSTTPKVRPDGGICLVLADVEEIIKIGAKLFDFFRVNLTFFSFGRALVEGHEDG